MMLAVRGATIKPMAGPDIPEGVLLASEGKIATVGGKDTHTCAALEAGKDADFVIWQGDPLDSRSRVWKTFIDGLEVYADKASREV